MQRKVSEFGQAVDGTDTARIQAGVKALPAGDSLHFARGEGAHGNAYIVHKAGRFGCVDLRGLHGRKFTFDPGVRVLLTPGDYPGGCWMWWAEDSHGGHMYGGISDGNRYNITASEQTHGLNLWKSRDWVVEGHRFVGHYGDGFRAYGALGAWTKNATLRRCVFDSCKRSAIGVQRAFADALFEDIEIFGDQSDQAIDFEPSPIAELAGPRNLTFRRVNITTQVPGPAWSVYGVSFHDPAVNIVIEDCDIGGYLYTVNVEGLIVRRSKIRAYTDSAAINMIRKAQDVHIYQNEVYSERGVGVSLQWNNNLAPDGVNLYRNVISAAKAGVTFEDAHAVCVSRNEVRSIGGAGSVGIKGTALRGPVYSPSIRYNKFSGYATGVELVASKGDITDAEVNGNTGAMTEYKPSGVGGFQVVPL